MPAAVNIAPTSLGRRARFASARATACCGILSLMSIWMRALSASSAAGSSLSASSNALRAAVRLPWRKRSAPSSAITVADFGCEATSGLNTASACWSERLAMNPRASINCTSGSCGAFEAASLACRSDASTSPRVRSIFASSSE